MSRMCCRFLLVFALVSLGGCQSVIRSYYIPPQPGLEEAPVVAVAAEGACKVGLLDYDVNPRLARAINEGGAADHANLPLIRTNTRALRAQRAAVYLAGTGILVTALGMTGIFVKSTFEPGNRFSSFEEVNEDALRRENNVRLQTTAIGIGMLVTAGTMALVAERRNVPVFDPMEDTNFDAVVVPYRFHGCWAFTPGQWASYADYLDTTVESQRAGVREFLERRQQAAP
jgi:hypothetical protein